MIAKKIFRFVDIATQSHRHEETDGFLKVLRGDRGHLREQSGKWSDLLGRFFSGRTEVLVLYYY